MPGQKSFLEKNETVVRKTFIVDADGQILGRLAVRVATVLRGKHKPTYTPHVDTGDMVVIINAEKIRVTGNKLKQKKYLRYTGYPSGQREITLEQMLDKKPEHVIELAIKRMLPKGRLGNKMYTKLYVYAGSTHPHAAQKPEVLEVQ